MYFKQLLCFAALVAVATASVKPLAVSYAQVLRNDGLAKVLKVSKYGGGMDGYGYGNPYKGYESAVDYYAYPKYEFEYKVSDPYTGDIKSQQEARDGDTVKGYYALIQPDGSERMVKYESEKKAGFRADVKYGTYHLKPLKYYSQH